MAEREIVLTQHDCGHDNRDTSSIPSVPPFASLTPPQFTGGVAFPANASTIFPLPQNLLTLLFNLLKLQPQNLGIWRRLKRIFAMLAKERKEAKEVLWEFLGLEGDDGDEVEICTKVLLMQNWLEKCLEYLLSKPPPAQVSTVWCIPAVPRLSRAPNTAACWRGG
jgi:hypothetical protein